MELNRAIIDSSFFPAPFNIQSELAVLNLITGGNFLTL